jgi:hypothetical protein
MIRCAALVLLATLSAFGGTFPVATAPLDEPAETRSVPELTAGREGYLASWVDARSGAPVLLAARVAADGSVLDATGILVAPVATSAKVVWNGERYLVFFSDGADLVVRPVSEDGAVGPMRTVVPNALLDLYEPLDVATNGQLIVIAYAGDKLSWDVRARVHAAVLSMDGTLLSDVLLDDARTDRLHPSVAALGSTFAVGWNRPVFTPAQELEGFGLWAVRLDARGVRLDAQPRHVGTTGMEAALHANGSSFVADRGWESWFVSADLTQTGAPVERPPGRFFTLRGAAAVVDEELAQVYGADIPRWVQVARYDEQGKPGASQRVLQGTEDGRSGIEGASAVERGDDVLIAWLTLAGGEPLRLHLFTTLVSSDTLAPKGEQRVLTRSAAPQRAPSLTAASATQALVTWKQPDGIYAGRITAGGRALDGPGIRLSEGQHTQVPVAAYHDGRYAVAFGQSIEEDRWEVVVRYLSPDGGLLPDTVRIPVSRWAGEVAMASGGGSLVLVWMDAGLHATRLHGGGAFDPPVDVIENWWGPLAPVVSFNGTHFLIAWVDTYLDYDWLYRLGISGRRMTPDLRFADPEPRTLVSFGSARDHNEPALASKGSEWLLTWTSSTSPFDPNPPSDEKKQVRIARIAADGTASSRFGDAVTRGFGAELVWTGSRLVMSWKDDAPGSPLYVAPLTAGLTVDASAQRTLDPSSMIYDDQQVSLGRWGSNWAAVYPLLGGAETGYVPRVLVTVEGRKARALR